MQEQPVKAAITYRDSDGETRFLIDGVRYIIQGLSDYAFKKFERIKKQTKSDGKALAWLKKNIRDGAMQRVDNER